MIKEPWLAVLLSFLLPGMGQFYLKKRWKALCISFLTICSFFWGIWSILSIHGDTKQGWILVAFSVCAYIGNLVDAWFTAKHCNRSHVTVKRENGKDIYLSIILTDILPGLGHMYLRQFKNGIFFLVAYFTMQFVETKWTMNVLLESILLSIALFNIFKKTVKVTNPRKIIRILIYVIIVEGFCMSSIIELALNKYICVKGYKGDSNLPTLKEGDVTAENIQERTNLKLGSFIVFSYKDLFEEQPRHLIKRLIGFEGEEVYLDSGAVFVNHHKLTGYPFSNLHYSSDSTCLYATKQYPYVVPPNCVFVLGDNSSHSLDSRSLGGINKQNIVSVVYKVIWPFDRIKTLEP